MTKERTLNIVNVVRTKKRVIPLSYRERYRDEGRPIGVAQDEGTHKWQRCKERELWGFCIGGGWLVCVCVWVCV
jgi:hypothetical protein